VSISRVVEHVFLRGPDHRVERVVSTEHLLVDEDDDSDTIYLTEDEMRDDDPESWPGPEDEA
jgi:hypothetical protein